MQNPTRNQHLLFFFRIFFRRVFWAFWAAAKSYVLSCSLKITRTKSSFRMLLVFSLLICTNDEHMHATCENNEPRLPSNPDHPGKIDEPSTGGALVTGHKCDKLLAPKAQCRNVGTRNFLFLVETNVLNYYLFLGSNSDSWNHVCGSIFRLCQESTVEPIREETVSYICIFVSIPSEMS